MSEYTFSRRYTYLMRDGQLVEWRWYHNLYRLTPRALWRVVTRRFRHHKVVSVDVALGTVTVAYERWSWLRWKWVRQ